MQWHIYIILVKFGDCFLPFFVFWLLSSSGIIKANKLAFGKILVVNEQKLKS